MDKFYKEYERYTHTRKSFWSQLARKAPSALGSFYRKSIVAIYQNFIPANSTVLELGCGTGTLLASLSPSYGVGVDFCPENIALAKARHPNLTFVLSDAHELDLPPQQFDFIVISELINDLWDVQKMLLALRPFCNQDTRILFNFYSHLWSGPIQIARKLGLAWPNLQQNWLTREDMGNLMEISGLQTIRMSEEILIPIYIPLVTRFANKYLVKLPIFRHLAFTNFMVARPVFHPENTQRSVSVIIAARNEAGHIEELIARIPQMGSSTEIIFVEGGSTDYTYATIERAIANHPNLNIRLMQQTGTGKGDAVRMGFDAARGEILMILDADITVPPEDLPRFYDLIANDTAEFVNGVRLIYPMDDGAMRFANLIGNKFFSWAFSWLLGQPIRDTLCGTKVLWNTGYKKIAANRSFFGNFDPFGDFDLLFGAAQLNLKILEVPIRYRARRYGETNISRWKHGVLLLKMVIFAANKIKFT